MITYFFPSLITLIINTEWQIGKYAGCGVQTPRFYSWWFNLCNTESLYRTNHLNFLNLISSSVTPKYQLLPMVALGAQSSASISNSFLSCRGWKSKNPYFPGSLAANLWKQSRSCHLEVFIQDEWRGRNMEANFLRIWLFSFRKQVAKMWVFLQQFSASSSS